MRPAKPTLFDLITNAAAIAVILLCTYQAWQSGAYFALLILSALCLMAIGVFISDLRQGTRPPTHFERFEHHRWVRALLILLGGGVCLVIGAKTIGATPWSGAFKFILIVGLAFIYAVVSWRALKQIRTRYESVGAYKQRTGYQDPPDEV